MRVRFRNFLYHLRHKSFTSPKWSWGFIKIWRYKRCGFCWKHGRSLRFNTEWYYWFCPKCKYKGQKNEWRQWAQSNLPEDRDLIVRDLEVTERHD